MSEEIYTLTARHRGRVLTARLPAYPPSFEAVRLCRSLGEADPERAARRLDLITTAIREILNRSAKNRGGPWAVGEIELTDPSGEVIHSMPAKEGAA